VKTPKYPKSKRDKQPNHIAVPIFKPATDARQFIMGASDSKLVFKKGIFRLSENKIIPADDPYWASVSQP
jgi:hypothetical protein